MSKFESNAVTWFELPVADMRRARSFYETLLNAQMQEFPGEEPCFIFPAEPQGVGGSLIERKGMKPAAEGTMVYLNVDGKLDATLERAKNLGAKLLVPRTAIPGGFGYFACLLDSEGNHFGLHSR
jgi:predicted enzyme related to lactoylglutathione lyase